jgi:hypothetical protein
MNWYLDIWMSETTVFHFINIKWNLRQYVLRNKIDEGIKNLFKWFICFFKRLLLSSIANASELIV